MRSFAIDLSRQRETRIECKGLALPFELTNSDSNELVQDFVLVNVSKSGLGLESARHIDPASTLKGEFCGKTIIFKVAHSTFLPQTQNFRWGLKVVSPSEEIDLTSIIPD